MNSFINKNFVYLLIKSIILFTILSFFTIYPHINTLIDRYNITITTPYEINKENRYIYVVKPNDTLSYDIFISNNLEYLKIFTANHNNIDIPLNIQINQYDNTISDTIIVKSKYINNWITIDLKNKDFSEGPISINIKNIGSNNILLFGNFPQFTSENLFINGEKGNGLALTIQLLYSNPLFLITCILIFIVIIIQIILSYIIVFKRTHSNITYYLTSCIFLLIIIIRFPLITFDAQPFFETLTHYIGINLKDSIGIIDKLLLYDYSLTILPSILNILAYTLQLDIYLPIFLYLSGIIITSLWASFFTLTYFRYLFSDYIRVIITFFMLNLMMIDVLYVSSTFIYTGIFLILFIYTYNLDKLSKIQFILLSLLLVSLLLSKAIFTALIPSAIFLTIMLWKQISKRTKLIYITIISSITFHSLFLALNKTHIATNTHFSPKLDELGGGNLYLNIIYYTISIFNNATGIYNITDKSISIIIGAIILLILFIYSCFNIITHKNAKHYIYIMACLIAIIANNGLLLLTNNLPIIQNIDWNITTHMSITRKLYCSYIMTFIIFIIIFHLFYKAKSNIKNQFIICILIILFTYTSYSWQQKNYSKIAYFSMDNYQHLHNVAYRDYAQFIHNKYVVIPSPMRPTGFYYKKNSMLISLEYNTSNNLYTSINKVIYNNSPTREYKNLQNNKLVNNKCIIAIFTEKSNVFINKGIITINLFDKNNELISATSQTNKNHTNHRSIGFIFDNPICNVDKIIFTDENNNVIYTNGWLELGLAVQNSN